MDNDLMRFRDNTILNVSRLVLNLIIGLLTSILIARALGPEGKGLFQLVLLLPTMVVTFGNLGIGSSTVYYLARKEYSIVDVVKGNLLISSVIAVLSVIISYFLILFLGNTVFPGVPTSLLYFSLLVIPVSLIKNILLSVFHGLQDFIVYNRLALAQPFFILVFIFSGFVLVGAEVEIFVYAYFIGTLIPLLITFSLLRKYFFMRSDNLKNYILDSLSYGWKAHLSNVLSFINYRFDLFLVNFFINPAAVGIYSLAVTLAEKLWMLSQSIAMVLMPRISELKDNEEKRRFITSFISRWMLVLNIMAAIAFGVIGYFFIPILYGVDFLQSVNILFLLLPGIVLGGVGKIFANDLAARGKPEINLYIAVVTIILNIGLNIYLIPRIGLSGAAIATLIAYSVDALLKMCYYSKVALVKWHQTIIPDRKDLIVLKKILKRNK